MASLETILDTVILGAEVVTGNRRLRATVGIRGGKVAVLADPAFTLSAREVIDATGMVVIPGIIDAHVHIREPGFTHKEGFETATMAAVAGGVTTIMAMPTTNPPTLTPKDFEEKIRLAEGKAYVNYALQAAVGEDLSTIEELAKLGAISFELFLAERPPALLIKDNGVLRTALARVAEVGAVAAVSPGDDGIVRVAMERLQALGRSDPRAWAESRPPCAEALGVARICLIARHLGVPVHVRDITTREAVEVLRAARARYNGVSAETSPHALLLSEDELERQGAYAKVGPPLRAGSDLESVWGGLLDGTIDIVATDHAPHLPAEKEAGRTNIWNAPGGFPGLQTFLPLMLGEVAKGRFSLADVVRCCSERPARLFGLYPRKGALDPGSDADLVIVDLGRTLTIRNEDQLSKARVTPFAGWTVVGAPTLTMLGGQTIMRDGKVLGRPIGALVMPR